MAAVDRKAQIDEVIRMEMPSEFLQVCHSVCAELGQDSGVEMIDRAKSLSARFRALLGDEGMADKLIADNRNNAFGEAVMGRMTEDKALEALEAISVDRKARLARVNALPQAFRQWYDLELGEYARGKLEWDKVHWHRGSLKENFERYQSGLSRVAKWIERFDPHRSPASLENLIVKSDWNAWNAVLGDVPDGTRTFHGEFLTGMLSFEELIARLERHATLAKAKGPVRLPWRINEAAQRCDDGEQSGGDWHHRATSCGPFSHRK